MSHLTSIAVESIVDCPFSIALDEADGLIRFVLAKGSGARGPGLAWRHVEVRTQRECDATEMGRSHDEIAFSWDAHSRWLPDLKGHLRFRPHGVATRLVLDAMYEPPLGAFGRALDSLAGQRVAIATCRDLLDQIGRALEDHWRAERLRPTG